MTFVRFEILKDGQDIENLCFGFFFKLPNPSNINITELIIIVNMLFTDLNDNAKCVPVHNSMCTTASVWYLYLKMLASLD